MYTLHIPATTGHRGRPATDVQFATLDALETHCARAAKYSGEMRYGWTSQVIQRAICPPKGEHGFSKGGEIKVTVGNLQGRHTLSWTFSGPNSSANISDSALDSSGNAG